MCFTAPLFAGTHTIDTLIHVVYWRNSMIYESKFPKWSAEKVNRRMEYPYRFHLFYNADTAYEYAQHGNKDPLAKSNPLGKDIRQHTYYHIYPSRETWIGINYPFQKYAPLVGLLKDTSKPLQWQLFSNEREILGYRCKLAIAVRPKGDSVIAWYTTDIPGKHNLRLVDGLPGTVLDFLWQEHNDHYFATVVESVSRRIAWPDSVHIISPAEWHQALNIRLNEEKNDPSLHIYRMH
jgi:GLPGLI family protein